MTTEVETEVEELLKRHAPRLDVQKWATKILLHMKSKNIHVDIVISLTEEDYQVLREQAENDAETRLLTDLFKEIKQKKEIKESQAFLLETKLKDFVSLYESLQQLGKRIRICFISLRELTSSTLDLVTIATSTSGLRTDQLEQVCNMFINRSQGSNQASRQNSCAALTASDRKFQVQELMKIFSPTPCQMKWTDTLGMFAQIRKISMFSLYEDESLLDELNDVFDNKTEMENCRNFLSHLRSDENRRVLEEAMNCMIKEIFSFFSELQRKTEEIILEFGKIRQNFVFLNCSPVDLRKIICCYIKEGLLSDDQIDVLIQMAQSNVQTNNTGIENQAQITPPNIGDSTEQQRETSQAKNRRDFLEEGQESVQKTDKTETPNEANAHESEPRKSAKKTDKTETPKEANTHESEPQKSVKKTDKTETPKEANTQESEPQKSAKKTDKIETPKEANTHESEPQKSVKKTEKTETPNEENTRESKPQKSVEHDENSLKNLNDRSTVRKSCELIDEKPEKSCFLTEIKLQSACYAELVQKLDLYSHFPNKITCQMLTQAGEIYTKAGIKHTEKIYARSAIELGLREDANRSNMASEAAAYIWSFVGPKADGHEGTPSIIVMSLLRRLMTLDFKARDEAQASYRLKGENISTQKQKSLFGDDDESSDENTLNSTDVLLVSYLCCDQEMQQILCRILFACKLAFPFIYTTSDNEIVMSRWSLRDIIVEYRDDQDNYIETSLISDHPFPVVSFARMGEVNASKSKLLNSIINGSGHNTFFHRDSANGFSKRRCSDGLVEATVYMPDRKNNVFQAAFLAANLRGDMLMFIEQRKILARVSQVFVVFVSLENIITKRNYFEELQQLDCQVNLLIVLYANSLSIIPLPQHLECLFRKVQTVTSFKNRRFKNEAEILADLKTALCSILKQPLRDTGLKSNQIAEFVGLDQDQEIIKFTQGMTNQVMQHLAKTDIAKFKKEHLSLQESWVKYSKAYKEVFSSKFDSSHKERSRSEANGHRNVQVECCINKSRLFISDFLKALRSLCGRDSAGLMARLFLQGIKLWLDENSRKYLPPLITKRDHLRDALQQGGNGESVLKSIECNLNTLETEIRDSSIGIENVFREVGQVYEAVLYDNSTKVSQDLRHSTDALPELFARLLLSGVPLEILDGDASNVPLSWISAILKRCERIAGGKKIFVISVLGLQSSGKSTLLNTMFGLKFAVCAGRCTRGAFLQLVPVESGMPFDYVAVIDTEGLRAPELGQDKYHHDNELATLVIGLGDVTVINIKGNTSEITQILQIAVHAFIKMKMANSMRDLHRHCIFIHQNVGAVGAKEKMKDGEFIMQQKLDEIVREAAESEGQGDKIKCFSDIISFNSESHIFYMPNLWLGDPPMAPVNPGYSQEVQKIKHILLTMLDPKKKSFLGFSDFSARIENLWQAIMSEDFVFSFRNSIEMKAYHLVESEYLGIRSKIEEVVENWLHKNALTRLKGSNSTDSLIKEKEVLEDELRKMIANCLINGSEKMETFFKESKYAEYTEQWRVRKLKSLSEFAKDEEIGARRKLLTMYKALVSDIEKMSKLSNWQNKIYEKAAQMAVTLKMKGQNRELVEQEFEKLWQSCIGELPPEDLPTSQNIHHEIETILRDLFSKHLTILNKFLERGPISSPLKHESVKFNANDFVPEESNSLVLEEKKILWIFTTRNKNLNKKVLELVAKNCNSVVDMVIVAIDDIRNQEMSFSKHGVKNICQIVHNGIIELERIEKGVRGTTALEIKLTIHALRLAYPVLVKSDSDFNKRSSLKTKMEAQKEQLRNMFHNMVQEQGSAKTAADFCRDHIAIVVKQVITERMEAKLKNRIVGLIGSSKYSLIVRMLTEMAQEDNYQSILVYVQDSHTCALKWITKFTEKIIFDDKSKEKFSCEFTRIIVKEFVEPFFEIIQRSAACDSGITIDDWISKFCDAVKCELPIFPKDLKLMTQKGSATPVKVEEMLKYFRDGIKALKEELVQWYNSMTKETVKWQGDKSLYSSILDSLWGCNEQCPFCNEPCRMAIANHYESDGSPHYCIQHRPQGVSGRYWKPTGDLYFDCCAFNVRKEANVAFGCSTCKLRKKKTDSCRQSDEISVNSDDEVYHPYSQYKKQFPEWEIEPNGSNESSKFWMWFSWTFQDKLKERYARGLAGIPPTWKAVSKKEAIDSLRSLLD